MHFLTLEQLLLDAILGALSMDMIDPDVGVSGSGDAVTRIGR